MGYEHQMPFNCIADGDLPVFLLRMIGVRKGGCERIEEHRGRVLKGYGVLGNVGRSLARVHSKVTFAVYLMASSMALSQPLPKRAGRRAATAHLICTT